MRTWVLYAFIFFFFKQKTAYERRISDWSSDVCSSDLLLAPAPSRNARARRRAPARLADDGRGLGDGDAPPPRRGLHDRVGDDAGRAFRLSQRSEERRVGKACGSSCRSWLAPYH